MSRAWGGRCRKRQHPRLLCPLPAYRPKPSEWRRLLVSLAGSLKRFRVGGEHPPDPVRVVGELLEGLDGEGDRLAVFVVNAVPPDENRLEQVVIALVAELGELGTTQAFERGIKGAGIEDAAICRLFDADGPLERLDLLANERHKA